MGAAFPAHAAPNVVRHPIGEPEGPQPDGDDRSDRFTGQARGEGRPTRRSYESCDSPGLSWLRHG
jgi:hypothetical protein